MHSHTLERWQHDHTFGADQRRSAERRTWWVIGLTAAMMVAEIVAGTLTGSMALLADGWHMGTHAAALGITVFAYAFARRHAGNPRYTFGTGKVGALGGFASAVGLAVVAVLVLVESAVRVAAPVAIHFDEAIGVAVIGLIVNLASALVLRDHDPGHAAHDRDQGHDDDHDHAAHAHPRDDDPAAPADHGHHDHNLRGAYLHVLADALTSVLAIVALTAGKHLDQAWMDPAMGIVGALVIGRWSVGLLRDTGAVLLDAEVPPARLQRLRHAIEADADNRVADLHVWRVGPRHLAAVVSVVTHAPRPPEHYKALLSGHHDLAHVTVEVNGCTGTPCGDPGRRPDHSASS